MTDRAQRDLTIYRGDGWAEVYPFQVAGDPPTPFDLDGYEVLAQIRRDSAVTSYEVLAEMTPVIEGGTITLHLTPEQTAALPGRDGSVCKWDLQLTSPDGAVWTPLFGSVRIIGDVSRPAPEVEP